MSKSSNSILVLRERFSTGCFLWSCLLLHCPTNLDESEKIFFGRKEHFLPPEVLDLQSGNGFVPLAHCQIFRTFICNGVYVVLVWVFRQIKVEILPECWSIEQRCVSISITFLNVFQWHRCLIKLHRHLFKLIKILNNFS